jgi:hypothetical protein
MRTLRTRACFFARMSYYLIRPRAHRGKFTASARRDGIDQIHVRNSSRAVAFSGLISYDDYPHQKLKLLLLREEKWSVPVTVGQIYRPSSAHGGPPGGGKPVCRFSSQSIGKALPILAPTGGAHGPERLFCLGHPREKEAEDRPNLVMTPR